MQKWEWLRERKRERGRDSQSERERESETKRGTCCHAVHFSSAGRGEAAGPADILIALLMDFRVDTLTLTRNELFNSAKRRPILDALHF